MMPNLVAQVAALGIAFVELAKMVGREQGVQVAQVANAIKAAAKASGVEIETSDTELARRLTS